MGDRTFTLRQTRDGQHGQDGPTSANESGLDGDSDTVLPVNTKGIPMTAIPTEPDPGPTPPVPPQPMVPPVQEPEPDRLPDDEPLPNPDENDDPPMVL